MAAAWTGRSSLSMEHGIPLIINHDPIELFSHTKVDEHRKTGSEQSFRAWRFRSRSKTMFDSFCESALLSQYSSAMLFPHSDRLSA